MASGLIVALEMLAVLGVALGWGVWELVKLRRERRHRGSAAEPGDGVR